MVIVSVRPDPPVCPPNLRVDDANVEDANVVEAKLDEAKPELFIRFVEEDSAMVVVDWLPLLPRNVLEPKAYVEVPTPGLAAAMADVTIAGSNT